MRQIPLQEIFLLVNHLDYNYLCANVSQEQWYLLLKTQSVIQKNLVLAVNNMNVSVAYTLPVERGMMDHGTKVILLKDFKNPIPLNKSVGLPGISKYDMMDSLSWHIPHTSESYNIDFNQDYDKEWIPYQIQVSSSQELHVNDCAFSPFHFIRMGFTKNRSLVHIQCAEGRVKTAFATVSKECIDQKQEAIVVSPLLAFNLGNSPHHIHPIGPLNKTKEYKDLQLAHKIELKCVLNDVSCDKNLHEESLEQLQKWFAVEDRIVTLDDVIVIEINEENARNKARITNSMQDFQSFCSKLASKKTLAFFTIVSVSVCDRETLESCRVDVHTTQIIQKGPVNSLVPPGIHTSYNVQDVWAPPKTQLQAYESIKSLVLTSLNHETPWSPCILVQGKSQSGKTSLIKSISDELGLCIFTFDVADSIKFGSEMEIRAHFELKLDLLSRVKTGIFLLENLDALNTPQFSYLMLTLLKEFKKRNSNLILICTIRQELKNDSILVFFPHHIILKSPDQSKRFEILQNLTRNFTLSLDIDLHEIALHTASFTPGDLCYLVSLSCEYAMRRIVEYTQSMGVTESEICSSGIILQLLDIQKALDKMRGDVSESISAPKIPRVNWEDIGGLEQVKNVILETFKLPLEHPELFTNGLKKRSGILLFGPPGIGTGKTLVAKAVATSLSLNFLSVKGPELLNMYIGESEANVRNIFEKAKSATPCVIFFDELDSIAPKRGDKGDAGGVMDRIVSQLLAELDGMGGKQDVFVIGATNRPDLLDSALLRPGRFDKLLYLSVPDSHAAQSNILKALTRKFHLGSNVDLDEIASKCPLQLTGADFYALCTDAMFQAISRSIDYIDDKVSQFNRDRSLKDYPVPITVQFYMENLALEADINPCVKQSDFLYSLERLSPSVSLQELERYNEIQQKFI